MLSAIADTQTQPAGGAASGTKLRLSRSIAAAVTLLIGAIPALYIGWFVARYAVEVPAMDDWEMAPLIVKAHTGQLTFADLFSQQEEARTIVPKLIFILSAAGGHWDVRDQMMLSVAICVATAIAIYILLRRARLGMIATAVCFWASALLIFSPAQFELWLFASGFPSYLPVLCILAALLVLETRWRLGVKFAIAALLATISTFTLAHGLLAWGLTFPVFLASHRVTRWKHWLAGWCVMAAACAGTYFYGYSKPAHLPDFAPAIGAGDYMQFLFAFLGGSFAYASDQHRVTTAIWVGAVALSLFVIAAIYAVGRIQDLDWRRRLLPWFALGLYSISSGVLATLGRVGFGLEYAISSRYVTFSLYLLVALVALTAIIASDVMRTAPARTSRIVVAAGALSLGLAGGFLFYSCFHPTVRIMYSIAARNRLARTAMTFSPVLETSAVIKRIIYPAPEVAIARAKELDELSILKPRLVRTAAIASLAHEDALNEKVASGWCDAIQPLDNGQYRASGWAALTGEKRPADAVILAHAVPGGSWTAFAISDAVVKRRDVARLLGKDQLWSGWFATFPRAAVPPGAVVSAWAVDVEGPKLYRLRDASPAQPF